MELYKFSWYTSARVHAKTSASIYILLNLRILFSTINSQYCRLEPVHSALELLASFSRSPPIPRYIIKSLLFSVEYIFKGLAHVIHVFIQSEERTNLDFDCPCLPCGTLETLKKKPLHFDLPVINTCSGPKGIMACFQHDPMWYFQRDVCRDARVLVSGEYMHRLWWLVKSVNSLIHSWLLKTVTKQHSTKWQKKSIWALLFLDDFVYTVTVLWFPNYRVYTDSNIKNSQNKDRCTNARWFG